MVVPRSTPLRHKVAHRLGHWLCGAACLGLGATTAQTSHAAPEACFKAYELGQRLDKDKRPLDARIEYARCAELCPDSLQRDCIAWQDAVESKLARVVLRVAHAEDEVSVYLDGVQLTPQEFAGPVDQRPPLWVTAGRHQLRAKLSGYDDYAEQLDLLEGEERPVVISFQKHEEPASSGEQIAPWVALGVGGLGILGFAYFGSQGLAGKSDLDSCRGHCSAEAVDDVRRDFLFADISLIVGLVGLGVGTYLLVDGGQDDVRRDGIASAWIQLGTRGGVSGAWVGGDVW
ncbi:MAG: hypothetical protein H6718_02355 [Polyangiaceae bacterium]|nr:hypothetical protein [Myxococcales bacterium]MCB9584206.1 hypothetical protein [Polyangiaceae bacterium]MCB9608632.1 hypothetical protein [Polyangiaceae bacterium]